MLSEEDLEQVKMQIANDLAEVRCEYDARIENLHNLARFWQTLAIKAIAAVTPASHDRSELRSLLDLLRSPAGSHYVDELDVDQSIDDASNMLSFAGQGDNTEAGGDTGQLRVDVDAIIRDSNDLYARTKETDEFQLSLLRRVTNFNAIVARLFCKMDYVHQGDIRELITAIMMDSDHPVPYDEVMAKVDDVLSRVDDLPEAPSGDRAREELDPREERAIMLDA